MLFNNFAAHLGMFPEPAYIILLFFGYSMLGYLMECVVLSADKKELVLDRGFVRHLPFCIIYGFGGLIGYAILSPMAGNWLIVFMAGAISATAFEFATAMLQIHMFGDFWWDYTEKPFNYKGMLCLESTIGWGFVALIIVYFLHNGIVNIVQEIPPFIALPLALTLASAYLLDFVFSARAARQKEKEQAQIENKTMECPLTGQSTKF